MLQTLIVKLPRDTPASPEQAAILLAALTEIAKKPPLFARFFGRKDNPFALELLVRDQQIRFQITCATHMVAFVRGQLVANYPTSWGIYRVAFHPVGVDGPELLPIDFNPGSVDQGDPGRLITHSAKWRLRVRVLSEATR